MEVANNVTSAEIRAVITRADGTVEDLGVLDSYDRRFAHLPEHIRKKLEAAHREDATDGDSRN